MNNRTSFYDYPYDTNEYNMINEMLINSMDNSNSIMMNNTLMEPFEGYIKGNLYNNLYDSYKDYKPNELIPSNEQAEMLLNINKLSFALQDIRLYLDINPNDQNMIKLFNDYQQKQENATEEYERKYGPILSDTKSQDNIFSWEEYSWPWEMGDK